MNFYSLFLLVALAAFAMAAPQRVIEKTTIIRGGPSRFERPPPPPPPPPRRFGGPQQQTTIIKKTVIHG